MNRTLLALLGLLALSGPAAAAVTPSALRFQAPPHDPRPARASLSPDSPQAATQGQEITAQRAHQKETIAIVRNIGTAMFSWLTDQVGAAAAGPPRASSERAVRAASAGASPPPVVLDMGDYPPISSHRLREILVPAYIARLDETDGWGHPLEFRLNVNDPLAKHVMCIRSPGRDGRFSGDSYSVSPFDPDDFDQDIVWCDGFFVRWPQRPAKPGNT